jgi:hypothetical protein
LRTCCFLLLVAILALIVLVAVEKVLLSSGTGDTVVVSISVLVALVVPDPLEGALAYSGTDVVVAEGSAEVETLETETSALLDVSEGRSEVKLLGAGADMKGGTDTLTGSGAPVAETLTLTATEALRIGKGLVGNDVLLSAAELAGEVRAVAALLLARALLDAGGMVDIDGLEALPMLLVGTVVAANDNVIDELLEEAGTLLGGAEVAVDEEALTMAEALRL